MSAEVARQFRTSPTIRVIELFDEQNAWLAIRHGRRLQREPRRIKWEVDIAR
jgi:hypothetical protein